MGNLWKCCKEEDLGGELRQLNYIPIRHISTKSTKPVHRSVIQPSKYSVLFDTYVSTNTYPVTPSPSPKHQRHNDNGHNNNHHHHHHDTTQNADYVDNNNDNNTSGRDCEDDGGDDN